MRIQEFKDLVAKALVVGKGFPKEQAYQIAACVTWAQLRGNPQDVRKLESMVYRPQSEMLVCDEGNACMLLDAGFHHPMPALNRAIKCAAKAAKSHGVGLVAVTQTDQSSGALGYFTQKAAKKYGMFAMLTSSTPPWVATHEGKKRVIGTNPISFAVPTLREPIVFDGSGAATSVYSVIAANAASAKLPRGVALTKAGKGTLDPGEVLAGGAIKSKGVFGSGIGVMVQAMSLFLIGPSDWGHLLLLVKPVWNEDKGLLVSSLARQIRNSGDNVFLPGERGNKVAKAVVKSRRMEIAPELRKTLMKMAGDK